MRGKTTNFIRKKLGSIIGWFENLKWNNWAAYCFVLFSIGVIINISTDFIFPHFFEHQILLITATTLLVYAIKTFFEDVHKFDSQSKESLLASNPGINAIYTNTLLPLQRSPWTVLACVTVTVFFFTCIILLKYISLDVIGIYALYIAGSSVMIGVYGYMQYLYFLWFIYKAGTYDYTHGPMLYSYNIYSPAESAWVIQLAKTSQRLRNFFLFIGLIYVIEYGILIPTDKITIGENVIILNMPSNIAFIGSWIALFILVIIAFPIINFIQRSLILKLVNKLKAHTIHELSELMYTEQRDIKNRKDRLQIIITYDVLIENIKKSKSYPINRQVSYETIMTIITFCVHVFNLFDKIAKIPQLAAFLP